MEQRLDDAVVWGSLIVYGAVWAYGPVLMGVTKFAWAGWVLAAVYVAGQAYEIGYRGHCYLSADATAAPAAFMAALLLLPLLHFGFDASWSVIARLVLSFAVAFTLAHVAAIVYGAVMTALLALVMPEAKE